MCIFRRLSSGSTRAIELDASARGCVDDPCLVSRPWLWRWLRDACPRPISAAMIDVSPGERVLDVALVPNGDLEEGTREE